MDERLDAGRHHLFNGEKALQQGYLDDSRSHFEAALLQFRGPELRIGEAHALRGLARVELGCGELALAEQAIRAAIQQYQEVRVLLDRVDLQGVSQELRRDAEEGEGASLVLLADVQLRSGRKGEARMALDGARELFRSLGDVPSTSGVWLALGRLELREGRSDAASEAFTRAISVNEASGDRSGQCHGWLSMAEVHRLAGRLDEAESALASAVELARGSHDQTLLGRALSQTGSVLLQLGRLEEARARYGEALPLIRDSGDVEMEGFTRVGLGDAASRQGDGDALQQLVEGARLLGSLDNQHGLGAAMLRLSQHGLRIDEPGLALAAAESARQLWYNQDPVRGVGQALRMEVKALAAMKQWVGVLTVAHCRAQVAGHVQPNALEVRDFYRARTPKALLDQLDAMSPQRLEDQAESLIATALEPVLAPIDLDALVLGSIGGALAVVDALVARGPRTPSVLGAAARGARAVDELPELPDDAIEALDGYELPDLEPRAPVAAEAAPPPPAEFDAAPMEPAEPSLAPPAPGEAAEGYEGLYDAPVVADDGDDDLDEDDDSEEEDDDDEDDDALIEELLRRPVPDDYADLYSLDDEED